MMCSGGFPDSLEERRAAGRAVRRTGLPARRERPGASVSGASVSGASVSDAPMRIVRVPRSQPPPNRNKLFRRDFAVSSGPPRGGAAATGLAFLCLTPINYLPYQTAWKIWQTLPALPILPIAGFPPHPRMKYLPSRLAPAGPARAAGTGSRRRDRLAPPGPAADQSHRRVIEASAQELDVAMLLEASEKLDRDTACCAQSGGPKPATGSMTDGISNRLWGNPS